MSGFGKSSGGGYDYGGTYFDTVTNSNDFRRQSWRDNYNDGKAAGDLTGNVNRRLDAERDASGGATESGSSTRYSARELAQLRAAAPAAPKAAVAAIATGVPQSPAHAAATATAKGSVVASLMAGAPHGGAGAFGSTLAYKPMDMAIGGGDFRANPYYSNAEDVETRWSDVGSAIYTPFVMGADLGHNAARVYFGENYSSLSPQQRLEIIGVRTQGAVKDAAESVHKSALEAAFAGMDAIRKWGEQNAARERAGQAAADAVDAAWDYREQLQAEEARKQGMPRWDGTVSTPPTHW